MEERRFDELTRVLGAATSRRQMLKGVLGGVLAVVVGRAVAPSVADAAGVCDRRACEREAGQVMVQCLSTCQHVFHKAGRFNISKLAGCKLGCVSAYELEKRECRSNATGCFASTACCDQRCVSLIADSNNCGACGHVCPDGHDCVDGQCQCGADQTKCGDQCVDTQTDNNNCGTCGNTCDSCETCLGGECQPLNCGSGQTCCQHLCVPACQGGPPDPTTCLCDQCDGQANGLSCGPNQVCCDQHCISEACPEGKTFDLNSCVCQCTPVDCPAGQTQDPVNCQCACTPVECPSGESQDPDTCQCVDKCASVTCGTCQTCDTNTGQCVQAPTGTSCGANLTCCDDGSCKATCLGCPDDRVKCGDTCCPANQVCGDNDTCQDPGGCDPACGPDEICCQGYGIVGDFTYGCVSASEFKICPVVPSTQAGASRGSWTCCPIDQSCCGGSGYFYNICGGEDADGVHTCCKPPQTECGPMCCNGGDKCFLSSNYTDYCCPADSGGVLDDGTCCSAGTAPDDGQCL